VALHFPGGFSIRSGSFFSIATDGTAVQAVLFVFPEEEICKQWFAECLPRGKNPCFYRQSTICRKNFTAEPMEWRTDYGAEAQVQPYGGAVLLG